MGGPRVILLAGNWHRQSRVGGCAMPIWHDCMHIQTVVWNAPKWPTWYSQHTANFKDSNSSVFKDKLPYSIHTFMFFLRLSDRASSSWNNVECQLDATRYIYWYILSSTCFGYIRPSSGARHHPHRTRYAAALKTTTHPKTRCRKPHAATQHLTLLMMGVCTQNMSS